MVCQKTESKPFLFWSVCEFSGASVNSCERLKARMGLLNFDGASENFWERLWNVWYQKNASFGLHDTKSPNTQCELLVKLQNMRC